MILVRDCIKNNLAKWYLETGKFSCSIVTHSKQLSGTQNTGAVGKSIKGFR